MRILASLALLTATALPAQEQNLVVTAASTGKFETLVNLLVATELDGALRGKDEFTVFAPTDRAFAKLGHKTLRKLLAPEGRDDLVRILKYHVVPGRVSAARAVSAGVAETLQGGLVAFSIDGGRLRVDQVSVVDNDVGASNGVIHVIDRVLTPPSAGVAKNEKVLRFRANWKNRVDEDGVEADVIEVTCTGGGSVRLTNIKARKLITRIAGGGKVLVTGQVGTHESQVNGGAVLEADELRTATTDVRVNGGGRARVNATEALGYSVNAGAKFEYRDTGARITRRQKSKYATVRAVPVAARHDDAARKKRHS